MISEKRKQAARANGARSRGPVTPEGKAISARNAMRHGLLAKSVVLCNEDEKIFEQLFYLLVRCYSPLDDAEMSAVEEMAAAHWCTRRAMAMQQALFDRGVRGHLDKSPSEQTLAVFTDPAHQTTIMLLQRYQARSQNMYLRALRTLSTHRRLPCRDLAGKDLAATNLRSSDFAELDLPTEDIPQGDQQTSGVPNEPKTPSVCNTAGPPAGQPAEPRPVRNPLAVPSEPQSDSNTPSFGGDADDRLWLSIDLRS